ncbi:hypothetical protein CEK62_09465 [Alcanivorax sp. N3-2A]|nr:hypothetical protein CEK62_09465 [Alcanivorax sp. N3-2A]
MAKRYAKKHLLWFIPAVVLLLIAAALAGVRLLGWHWQGLGWRQGPVLASLWQERDGCRPLQAHGVRVKGAWPLVVEVDTLGIGDCPVPDSDEPFEGLPWLPPFEATVWALQLYSYPPVTVRARQRHGQWHASAEFRGSQAQADYNADSGAWRVDGEVQGGHLNTALTGSVTVNGEGVWDPGQENQGEVALRGKGIGAVDGGPRGDVSAHGQWQGPRWRLTAAVDEPVALAQGWVLQPGKDIHARGNGSLIEQAQARLSAAGPEGRADLALASRAGRLGEGQGTLRLSEGVQGEVAFTWSHSALTVAPFDLSLPETVRVRLSEPVTVPLASEGDAQVPLTLSYQQITLASTESRVHWRPNDVQWRGALTVQGHWQGYRVSGGWRGDINPVGVNGEPVTLRLRNADLDINARVPVDTLRAPDWPLTAHLNGHYRQWPFSATASAARLGDGWGGALRGNGGTPPGFSQGGKSTFNADWRWQQRLSLLAGARLSIAEAVQANRLLRPLTLTARSPLTLSADGVRGDLVFEAAGLVAARWVLPPVSGGAQFRGDTFLASLRVPEWGSTLSLKGRGLGGGPLQGTFNGETPLLPAISRGLDLTTRSGQVGLGGDWRWNKTLSASARLRVSDARLEFGGIPADHLDADLDLTWDGEKARVRCRQPITLGSVDVGTPITAIQMGLDTDLETWRFDHIGAQLLGGELRAPRLVWPSPDWQPVVLTGIDLAKLAALQSEQAVTLAGRVGGYLPLRLGRRSLAVREGRLANESELNLAILDSSGVQAMAASNQAVALALDSLNPLRIDTFQAKLNMSDDGWLDAAVTIKGINPQQNRLPVVFNYTHKENVLELLRSLRIGDTITDQVMAR